MSDIEWICVAGKSFAYCATLLDKIRQLKETLQKTKADVTRLKTVVKELQEQHGYTQSTKLELLLRRMDPGKFSSYKEFMRALLSEVLANTNFSFDELNYDLYPLNKEIFNQLNRETIAFFKLLANRRPDVILDDPNS